MSLKEKLKLSLGNRTKIELNEIHNSELKREEEIFSRLYNSENKENAHNSYNAIPKFYFALPKENETMKVNCNILRDFWWSFL